MVNASWSPSTVPLTGPVTVTGLVTRIDPSTMPAVAVVISTVPGYAVPSTTNSA